VYATDRLSTRQPHVDRSDSATRRLQRPTARSSKGTLYIIKIGRYALKVLMRLGRWLYSWPVNVAVYKDKDPSNPMRGFEGYLRSSARCAIASLPSMNPSSFEGPGDYTEQASQSQNISYSPSIEPGDTGSRTSLLSMADFPYNQSQYQLIRVAVMHLTIYFDN